MQGREELSSAAVERGPSEGVRPGSKESSSRLSATPSEAARCASTGMNYVAILLLTARSTTVCLAVQPAGSSRQVTQGAPKHATDRDSYLIRPTT
jgi:hypothetical protein